MARDEQKLDDEARSLGAKATEVEAKMYSGEISSPRELQAMQSDVEQLRKHQRNVENRELELMEAREPLDATLAELEQHRSVLEGELERIRRTLADAEAVIVAEVGEERAARDRIAAGIDERPGEGVRAVPGAGARRRGGAARRHHLPGMSPVDPRHRGGADQEVGRRSVGLLRQLRRDPGSLMLDAVLIYFDGGARGNPGPAAIGAVVLDRVEHAAAAARRGQRAHRGDHQQRGRVPGADRGARSGGGDAGTCCPRARRLEAGDRAGAPGAGR